jgi:hypothetical protein
MRGKSGTCRVRSFLDLVVSDLRSKTGEKGRGHPVVSQRLIGEKRYVVAGLVDTTGYAADVRAKYEGFFITDSPIRINGSDLTVGAYGFGFSDDGKMQILDLAGNTVLAVSTTKDSELKRPRPLMMTATAEGLRFYGGKDYVTITAK